MLSRAVCRPKRARARLRRRRSRRNAAAKRSTAGARQRQQLRPWRSRSASVGAGARRLSISFKPMVQRVDERAAPLRVVEQVVLQIGIALDDPDVAQHLEQHPRRAAGAPLAAQLLEQRARSARRAAGSRSRDRRTTCSCTGISRRRRRVALEHRISGVGAFISRPSCERNPSLDSIAEVAGILSSAGNAHPAPHGLEVRQRDQKNDISRCQTPSGTQSSAHCHGDVPDAACQASSRPPIARTAGAASRPPRRAGRRPPAGTRRTAAFGPSRSNHPR